ncbi:MAG: TM1266 family iron-only hydrogenase system putative regulator [Christensenellaceae bacterium]
MEEMEETRLAIVSVLIEDRSDSREVNALLSEYGEYVKGRMGLPYPPKGVSVLSVVIDAPLSVINALTGKLGRLPSVTAKALCSKY